MSKYWRSVQSKQIKRNLSLDKEDELSCHDTSSIRCDKPLILLQIIKGQTDSYRLPMNETLHTCKHWSQDYSLNITFGHH